MKVGMYFGYEPKRNFSIKQEGLGRYVAELTGSLIDSDEVTIACGSWFIPVVLDLFEDYKYDIDKVSFLVSSKEPILLKLYGIIINRSKQKRRVRRRRLGRKSIGKIVGFFLGITDIILFVVLMLFLFVLGLICVPIFVIYVLGHYIYYNVRKKSVKAIDIIQLFKRKISDIIYENGIIEKLRQQAGLNLIKRINELELDIWYIPMAFWPEVTEIKTKKVQCIPDNVVVDFAENFSVYPIVKGANVVRDVIKGGDFFITYCEYVADTLLHDTYCISRDRIRVVPHAVNDSSRLLIKEGGRVDQKFAVEVLRTVLEHCTIKSRYVEEIEMFAVEDIRYIFYATQARGNKNLFNLIKAYEFLLRRKNIGHKLFLTCDLNGVEGLKEYVYEHGLQYDVLCFRSVSNQQLAALYACADLVVSPTLYEGGFPFTFGEAMSVDTPCVMSKIPQVLSVVNTYDLEKYFFDPYVLEDIIDKVYYALNNIDRLYTDEKVLYDHMNRRRWTDVGREYKDAFSYFSSIADSM